MTSLVLLLDGVFALCLLGILANMRQAKRRRPPE